MEEFPTLKGSWPWPWPWIRSYCILSCITHRPLPTCQISLKSKKLFVDRWTYGHLRPTYLKTTLDNSAISYAENWLALESQHNWSNAYSFMSPVVDGLVRASALCFLQCFDTGSCVTKTSVYKKTRSTNLSLSEVSSQNRWRRRTQGGTGSYRFTCMKKNSHYTGK